MHYYCCSLSSRCYYYCNPNRPGGEGIEQQAKRNKCPRVQSCFCTSASASEVELELLSLSARGAAAEKQGLPLLSMDSVYQQQQEQEQEKRQQQQHQFSPTNYTNRRRLVDSQYYNGDALAIPQLTFGAENTPTKLTI